MAQVMLRKLVKKYDDTLAVRGIDLDIADKEFVVLVGPSGCGKSTTLRMIAGLEDVVDVPPKDRDIAMVFQNYALYPHMTVYENMSFGLRLKRFPRDEMERRVQHAARILDITELLERKPRQLSGGQRQRVAMGRAIVRDPKVFLFDEPLSNLDAKLRVAMRAEIKALHQRLKTTTIYVTHDQVEAMTMADRIAGRYPRPGREVRHPPGAHRARRPKQRRHRRRSGRGRADGCGNGTRGPGRGRLHHDRHARTREPAPRRQ